MKVLAWIVANNEESRHQPINFGSRETYAETEPPRIEVFDFYAHQFNFEASIKRRCRPPVVSRNPSVGGGRPRPPTWVRARPPLRRARGRTLRRSRRRT